MLGKILIVVFVVLTLLLLVSVLIFIRTSNNLGESNNLPVPFWIEDQMSWWANDKIDDSEIVPAILWFGIKENTRFTIIDGSTQIPTSLKYEARRWISGNISDNAFFGIIKSDIEDGDIEISSKTPFDINDYSEGMFSGYSPLFRTFAYKKDMVLQDGSLTPTEIQFAKRFNQTENYSRLEDTNKKSVVIVPLFTSTAYSKLGFYDYYHGICDDKCLTRNIAYGEPYRFTGSSNAVKVFKLLGYDTITDIDVDMNPKILSDYDQVIVLHNEYVTQKEFDAITKHPKVLYLYPNALYAKINVDYENDKISLVRGHGYPTGNVANGFGWVDDNSKLESNVLCSHWKFIEVKNGKMLDCYPENIIYNDFDLLKTINGY